MELTPTTQTELQNEVNSLVKSEIEVVDQPSFALANGLIARLQTQKKKVIDFFADSKRKAAEAHKAICNAEKAMLTPVDTRINALKCATTRWYAAEQQRIAAEEEKKRREAEDMARLAAEAEESGDAEMAQQAVIEATLAEASVPVMPKCEGTSMRAIWKAVVTDPDKVPREYLIVNQSALDALAKATKGSITIPGVRFEKTFVNSTRAK